MHSSWNRREFMIGFAGLTGAALAACGGSQSGSNSSAANLPPATAAPQPAPSGALTAASVSVGAVTPRAIGNAFVGLSYEKSTLYEPLFRASNASLIGLLQRLGTSILRIGGHSVDENVWNPNGAGQTAGQIAPSDVDALAGFIQATGWSVLYAVNLGGSATGATTPALAAAEVAYVSGKLGSSLIGIEIGNECNLYGDTGSYYAGSWSLAQFETLWSTYRSAIITAVPGVSVTGPASSGAGLANWTIPFGTAVTSSNINLLTQHYYRANGKLATSTAAALITPDPMLVSNLSLLQSGAANIGLPFRIAECNSYSSGGSSGVSDSYASALWIIDFLFDCAQGGAVGVNMHGGGDGAGYTPIADSTGAVVGARPEYYGMLLFTLAGMGALYQTQVAAGALNVTAYALRTTAGSFSIVIVNKDLTANLQCAVTLPMLVRSATLLEMTQNSPGASGPSLTATADVTLQSAQVATNGAFAPAVPYTLTTNGSSLSCYVPALSAVLINIS